MLLTKICLIVVCCCCTVVYGQSEAANTKDTTRLESTDVYGYTKVGQINRQAYNVTAIDTRQLKNTTQDIAHVLDRIPGARLRETGGVGSDFDLSINGFSGKRIRFYLDGVPMDNFGPAFQINNIPVNTVERIEVYKGVIPVWLGSDALGGAVNIITDNQLKDYLDVSYAFGSFNKHRSSLNAAKTSRGGFTVRLNAFQNYSDNNYAVTVDAADIRTGKYTPNAKLKRFHDKYHNETAILQLGVVDKKWADQFLLGITAGQYYKEIQTGARMTAVFGAWHTKGNTVMPTLKYQKKDVFTKGLDVILNGNYNFGREQSIDTVHARFGWYGDSLTLRGKGGEQWYSHYRYRNNIANSTTTITYKINDRQYLAFNNTYSHFDRKGFNAVSVNREMDSIPRKASKNVAGLSYQYMISDRWNATVFGKYLSQHAYTMLVETDVFNGGDTIYTDVRANRQKWGYGIATTYLVRPQLQLKFSYEKTNRLPESEDLFGDVINKEGNWNVQPESSNNINLGVNYTVPMKDHRLYVGLGGIYYYAKNYIYNVFNHNTNKLYADNLMDVANLGFESELRYSYKQIASIGANLTYQNIRDRRRYRADLPDVYSDTYKKRIPNVPYLFGNVDANAYFAHVLAPDDKLTIGYNMLYVHDFYLYWENEGAADSKRTVPMQLAHDINVIYAMKGGKYNLGLECRNITDRKLYDNFSLQKPGRAFNVKLRYFIN
ncbi:MAG: TonB-dependent receptor plug domain-containing protein [Sphingobacterium sp.]|nr:TonB-dependent receptor plug domain-containing protein [Sphingobacterium sp.]